MKNKCARRKSGTSKVLIRIGAITNRKLKKKKKIFFYHDQIMTASKLFK